jgi:hypothetical protein
MCVYCKAASTVLDTLWEDGEFRAYFRGLGRDLGSLGPLTHDVFVPAYLGLKRSLQGGELELLEAQVAEDMLAPLYDRPHFREMWEAMDQAARDLFLREQSEMQLAALLVMAYDAQIAEAYKQAYQAYQQKRKA